MAQKVVVKDEIRDSAGKPMPEHVAKALAKFPLKREAKADAQTTSS
jgi:hypothetical protein